MVLKREEVVVIVDLVEEKRRWRWCLGVGEVVERRRNEGGSDSVVVVVDGDRDDGEEIARVIAGVISEVVARVKFGSSLEVVMVG